ncbi:hypothetical protein HZH66_008809 [Vespula vulgaris]|uniref:Uncharacterized protein n=1 Tax=Vespula vulgaris TaxID=7454 RepID=A0A834JR35_VESVU|nr:hypothetical protein HZH66_008809 [Vespula vulgaris]
MFNSSLVPAHGTMERGEEYKEREKKESPWSSSTPSQEEFGYDSKEARLERWGQPCHPWAIVQGDFLWHVGCLGDDRKRFSAG